MKDSSPWLRGARLGAAAILGLGLVLPTVTACTSPASDETEQVEEDSGDTEDTEDTEESEPAADIEE